MNPSAKIGAFFDLDGTLVASPSLEWQFIGYLLGRDAMGGGEIVRWLAQCAKDCLRDPRAATIGNKQYLAGLRESLADDWANSLAPCSPQFFPAGIERVAWHFAQGHRVFLISGTLKPLARDCRAASSRDRSKSARPSSKFAAAIGPAGSPANT